MEDLDSSLNNLRLRYKKIFLKVAQDLHRYIYSLKPENLSGEIFDTYNENSSGDKWQKSVLKFLNTDIKAKILQKIKDISTQRKDFSCSGCGICCRLACSEFSFEQLQLKAQNGDNFAKQFIQIFVPYGSSSEPENLFPQYVQMLKKVEDGGYYFYHCPKVTDDNRCPDYENRPQICRDFPDNPVAFLPPNCGYDKWKSNTEDAYLELNAIAEIANFYKNRLKRIEE